MTEDLESRIKALEEKLTPPLDKMSTMKASNKLKQYLVDLKKGTQEDAVWWLIEEAEKVPALEKDISMLEKTIIEMSTELGDSTLENQRLITRNKELENK